MCDVWGRVCRILKRMCVCVIVGGIVKRMCVYVWGFVMCGCVYVCGGL